MKLTSVKMTVAALVVASNLNMVHGALVSSSNPGGIIPAPAKALDDDVTNTQMEGFDERQSVTLAADLSVDGGIVTKGTVVDSHMIFLNSEGNALLENNDVVWTFDGPILGVMSDSNGNLEAASTPFLGAIGTAYDAPFNARGLEGNSGIAGTSDGYLVAGSTLTVDMRVTEPGDWIRVVTASSVPDSPLGTGLVAFALALGMVAARRQVVSA